MISIFLILLNNYNTLLRKGELIKERFLLQFRVHSSASTRDFRLETPNSKKSLILTCRSMFERAEKDFEAGTLILDLVRFWGSSVDLDLN